MKTKQIALCACLAALFAGSGGVFAAQPAQIVCKDGTMSGAEHARGACSGHGGIDKKGTANTAAADRSATVDKGNDTRKVGAGPAKVWANESTKVYHCPGDVWYGKTKRGEYMSEADAKAKGFHADHGKACGS